MTIKYQDCAIAFETAHKSIEKLGFQLVWADAPPPPSRFWGYSEHFESAEFDLHIVYDVRDHQVQVSLRQKSFGEHKDLPQLWLVMGLGAYQAVKTSCTSAKMLPKILAMQLEQLKVVIAKIKAMSEQERRELALAAHPWGSID